MIIDVRCSLCGKWTREAATRARRAARFVCDTCLALSARAADGEKTPRPRRVPYSLGFVDDRAIETFMSRQFVVPRIQLEEYEVDAETLALVPAALCRTHAVLPVSTAGMALILAMTDSTDLAAIDALTTATGRTIQPVVATESAIRAAIERYYPASQEP